MVTELARVHVHLRSSEESLVKQCRAREHADELQSLEHSAVCGRQLLLEAFWAEAEDGEHRCPVVTSNRKLKCRERLLGTSKAHTGTGML